MLPCRITRSIRRSVLRHSSGACDGLRTKRPDAGAATSTSAAQSSQRVPCGGAARFPHELVELGQSGRTTNRSLISQRHRPSACVASAVTQERRRGRALEAGIHGLRLSGLRSRPLVAELGALRCHRNRLIQTGYSETLFLVTCRGSISHCVELLCVSLSIRSWAGFSDLRVLEANRIDRATSFWLPHAWSASDDIPYLAISCLCLYHSSTVRTRLGAK